MRVGANWLGIQARSGINPTALEAFLDEMFPLREKRPRAVRGLSSLLGTEKWLEFRK